MTPDQFSDMFGFVFSRDGSHLKQHNLAPNAHALGVSPYVIQSSHFCPQRSEQQSLQQVSLQRHPIQQRHTITLGLYTGSRASPSLSEIPFDVRKMPNMSHKEKVNNWIANIPMYPVLQTTQNSSMSLRCTSYQEVSHHELTELTWHNECYPGVVSTSSSVSLADKHNGSHEWTDMGWQNIWRSTSRHDGKQFNGSRGNDYLERHRGLFVEHDDLLEYQAHKITRLVNRIYQMDTSESVRRCEASGVSTPLMESIIKRSPVSKVDCPIHETSETYAPSLRYQREHHVPRGSARPKLIGTPQAIPFPDHGFSSPRVYDNGEHVVAITDEDDEPVDVNQKIQEEQVSLEFFEGAARLHFPSKKPSAADVPLKECVSANIRGNDGLQQTTLFDSPRARASPGTLNPGKRVLRSRKQKVSEHL